MKNNFFEQYKNGELPEVKKNLDKLEVAVKKFNSSSKSVDGLTPDERKKINDDMLYYLSGQRKELPDFKGVLSNEEIEDLKKIIAALKGAGVSFKIENEKGVRRLRGLRVTFGSLSVCLLVGPIVAFPILGPICLIIGGATALVTTYGTYKTNKELKSAIESNKTVGKMANEIGFEFTPDLGNRLKMSEIKKETKRQAIAGLERADNLVGWYDRMGGDFNNTTLTKIHKAFKQSIQIIEEDKILNTSNNEELKIAVSFINKLLRVVSNENNINLLQRTKLYLENIYHQKDIEKSFDEVFYEPASSFEDNGSTIGLFESLKKSVVVQDITKSKAELIVNAGYRGAGKGVDGAIFKAFNKDGSLEKAVKEAIKNLDHEPVVGDVMLTEVNSKKIIHTVPPDFVNSHPREAKTKLVDLYVNILKQIRASGVKSATIPLICAGNYGAPLEWAFECFMTAYEQEPLNDLKLDFCFYGNIKTLDDKTVSAEKAVDIAKKMIDERINDVNKTIDEAHHEEKNEIDKKNDDDLELGMKNIAKGAYIENEDNNEKNSFNNDGLTINKEQVVGILEKKYEKLLEEIKPNIGYEQMHYESILKLGRVVDAIKNDQAFDTNDFVDTIDRLKNSINDENEKDFGDANKIKQIALYLISKEIDDKSKLATKAKDIYENKIKKGDLLNQDKNVTILNPGYKGEAGDRPTVDSMVFDKLGLEKNGEVSKEMKNNDTQVKFFKNDRGSTVLNKIDFDSFEPTEENLAEVYCQSFKECDNQTESLACPLVGDGSLKSEIGSVVSGAVKGFDDFIHENPNSKLDIKYIIYEKDGEADKKIETMENGFKNLANKYQKEISEAKNKLNEISNLEIKTQTKEIKISPTKIIKKPSVKALTLVKNKAKAKTNNKNKKTETDKNDNLIQ